MNRSQGPSKPPDGPYGPGWNGAEDAYWEDWGASADHPSRPTKTRNGAIVTAIFGLALAVTAAVNWFRGQLDWAPILLAISQLGFSTTLYLEYRKLLKKEADGEGS